MQNDRQISFGEFRFDQVNECLWRNGEAVLLRPKAFAVLRYLVERAGQLVSKQQLLEAVWPDTFVSDAVLKDSVRQLREALGDDVKSPRFIETAHRRGYRFIGQIPQNTFTEIGHSERSGNYLPQPAPGLENNYFDSEFPQAGLVGRETEMDWIRDCFRKMLLGERQIAFVTGEPGIGKTTLVEAFLQEISVYQNIRVGRGQCLEQYGEGEAYLPALEAVSRLAREPNGAERFIELMTRYAPTWLLRIPSLLNALGRESRPSQAGATQERMLREMAELIEAAAAETPLVLLFEDLHWSDYSTLDLISYLARRREPARLMVIGTYRPVELILSDHPLKEIKRELQIQRLCKALPLAYLTQEAIAEFLEKRLSGQGADPDLVTLIHSHTEGNPLFMVNLTDYFLDEQIIIQHSDGKWRLKESAAEFRLEVPENIRHLIERQIERLSAEDQRVLEAASVVGMDCSATAISAGLDEDMDRIEEICDKLARNHHFLLPAYLAQLPDGSYTPRYKFIHVLYLNVLYKRIAPTRRSRIHSRIGQRGEEIYGPRVAEISAELAVHFEQARDWERAVRFLQMAAENAAACCARHEAVALARKGLDLLASLPDTLEHRAHEQSFRRLLEIQNR